MQLKAGVFSPAFKTKIMNKYITEYYKDGLLFPGPEIIAPSEELAQKIANGTGLNEIKVIGKLVKVLYWGQYTDFAELEPYKGGR